MKTIIRSDEVYPFYDHSPEASNVTAWKLWARDVPDQTIKKWDRVMDEFWKVQEEMESYYAKSK